MGIRMLLLRGTFRAFEWGVRENLGVGPVVYIPLGVGHFNGSVVLVQSTEGSGLIKIVYSSQTWELGISDVPKGALNGYPETKILGVGYPASPR